MGKVRDKKVMVQEEGKDGEKRLANNTKHLREILGYALVEVPRENY